MLPREAERRSAFRQSCVRDRKEGLGKREEGVEDLLGLSRSQLGRRRLGTGAEWAWQGEWGAPIGRDDLGGISR